MASKHECEWKDIMPVMVNDFKNRMIWRTQMLGALVTVGLFVVGHILAGFVWASNVRADVQQLRISVNQHSFILDKCMGALLDARMASQAKVERSQL